MEAKAHYEGYLVCIVMKKKTSPLVPVTPEDYVTKYPCFKQCVRQKFKPSCY